jgi:outer membrane protein OmpA-like peptidoglycan-associated protein
MRYPLILRLLISSLTISPGVHAQPPSKERLVEQLKPAPSKPVPSKTMKPRGIWVTPDGTVAQPINSNAQQLNTDENSQPGENFNDPNVTTESTVQPTVQLQSISFEFNSAKLTEEARQTLDNLAAALNDSALIYCKRS